MCSIDFFMESAPKSYLTWHHRLPSTIGSLDTRAEFILTTCRRSRQARCIFRNLSGYELLSYGINFLLRCFMMLWHVIIYTRFKKSAPFSVRISLVVYTSGIVYDHDQQLAFVIRWTDQHKTLHIYSSDYRKRHRVPYIPDGMRGTWTVSEN